MLKAVIFDLDDTLCNTSEVIEESLKSTFTDLLEGFPGKSVGEIMQINARAFSELFTDPDIPVPVAENVVWYRTFELLGLKPSIHTIYKLDRMLKDELIRKLSLTKGTFEVFEYLKARKIKIGVLTNAGFLEQAEKLIALGVDRFIDYVVSPDICTVNKPDPKAFNYILDKLEVRPENTLMVGDNPVADIKGGNNAGIKTVWIKNRYLEYQNEPQFTHKINDLFELKDILITIK